MTIVLWILQIVLALTFAGAGSMKLSQTREQMTQAPQMAWAKDFKPSTIKLIGTLEVLAAIGLILPWAFDIVPILTPLAALGLAFLMIGALATHLRRKEFSFLPINVIFGAMAVFVALGRF